jgi:hypothetical protein
MSSEKNYFIPCVWKLFENLVNYFHHRLFVEWLFDDTLLIQNCCNITYVYISCLSCLLKLEHIRSYA